MAVTKKPGYYFPAKIAFIKGKKTTVDNRFDDGDEMSPSIKATPAFIADPENEKNMKTGTDWAVDSLLGRYGYRPETMKIPVPGFLIVDNIFTDVKIVTMDFRGNGGRAYKVVINGKYYCDFREDILLDCILNEGIGKGGVLKGSFSWMKYGQHTKLVRVGSKLHKRISAL